MALSPWVSVTKACLSICSCCCDKMPRQRQLKGEWVCFGLQFRGQSIMVGKSRQPNLKRLGQRSIMNACLLVPACSLPKHSILTSIDVIQKSTQRLSSRLPQGDNHLTIGKLSWWSFGCVCVCCIYSYIYIIDISIACLIRHSLKQPYNDGSLRMPRLGDWSKGEQMYLVSCPILPCSDPALLWWLFVSNCVCCPQTCCLCLPSFAGKIGEARGKTALEHEMNIPGLTKDSSEVANHAPFSLMWQIMLLFPYEKSWLFYLSASLPA